MLLLALYLTSKTHLLMITLQLSGKSVRVYIIFVCRELSFHCIIVNHYSVYSNLSALSIIFEIRISFNLKYEMDSFK
jgi:hypothetical protein